METGRKPRIVRPFLEGTRTRAILLMCGILAPLLYAATLVLVPMGWEDYSSASRAVSELSAIDAPTRPL